MDSLTSLISKPLEAATAVLQSAAAAAAAGGAAAAAGPSQSLLQGNATFTDDTIRMLLYSLFHGDSRLQAQVCQQYYSKDVTFSFNEGLLEVHGQEHLQQLLRGLQLLARFKPEVLDISSNAEKAIILLNLNLSYKLLPLTWWFPVKAPATITLRFGTPTDSVVTATSDVITHHHQEMSLVDLFVWNPAWDWFYRCYWAPYSGKLLAQLLHWEQHLISNYSSYLSGGAGHVQATVWTLEDQARRLGLQGLPSVAAQLTARATRPGDWQQQQQEGVPPPEQQHHLQQEVAAPREQQQQQQPQPPQGMLVETQQQQQQQQEEVPSVVTPSDHWMQHDWGSCPGSPDIADSASPQRAAAAAVRGSFKPRSAPSAAAFTISVKEVHASRSGTADKGSSSSIKHKSSSSSSSSSSNKAAAATAAPSARLGLTAAVVPEASSSPSTAADAGGPKLSELEATELAAKLGPLDAQRGDSAAAAAAAAAHSTQSDLSPPPTLEMYPAAPAAGEQHRCSGSSRSSSGPKRLSELETRELAAAAAVGATS